VIRKAVVVTAAIAAASFGLVACSGGESGHTPKDVRIQHYTDPESGRSCLVFMHDTMQGASMAVHCWPVVTE
jgi:hypothetical protein